MAERCAIGVVAAVAAVVAYRAWTQSLTIDEARSYNLFMAQPMLRMFASFDAANDVLQTLLSKFSIGLFGLAEFALRLPSVLGALLYLTSALRLSHYPSGRTEIYGVPMITLAVLEPIGRRCVFAVFSVLMFAAGIATTYFQDAIRVIGAQEDKAPIGKRGLRTIFCDPVTGAMLAEKP